MLDTFLNYDQVVTHTNIVALASEIKHALCHKDKLRIVTPARELMFQDDPEAVFLSMPAVSKEYGIYINKIASIFDRAPSDSLDIVNALVTVFSSITGEPLALLDGNALTNVKCAAVTAAVTDYCALSESRVLAVIGAGVQARQQVLGVCAVRNIQRINLYSKSHDKLQAFAQEITDHHNIEVVITPTIEEAIRSADIISTATTATEPLNAFSDVLRHVHINCMGGHTEQTREVPESLLRTWFVTVEDKQTAIAEAGAVHEMATEISDLPSLDENDLRSKQTIFSSTGHSFLDLIATAHVLKNHGLLGPRLVD
jgi:ornithine cyclodeaminase